MKVPRRHLLRAAAASSAVAGSLGLAGCQTLTETPHLLVVENETDTAHAVTIVVRRATDGTTSDPRAETTGTSPRFVVDFTYDVSAGGRQEGPGVLPTEDTYEVVATAPDIGTARTTYIDRESVRITLTDGDIAVETFSPS
ncbi:hypothetical protein [Halorubellus sp. PRR65]|uniref:hypothetical protein n=1 Tax=Halorubellus sp. PRR65 TaxID=3098148 RepID=UPI002B25AE34|nr:hypothetical protein [Halorubellus sp. PRR65]